MSQGKAENHTLEPSGLRSQRIYGLKPPYSLCIAALTILILLLILSSR